MLNELFIERKFSISKLTRFQGKKKSKILTHKNQDKHAKLAILNLAASNKSHRTYFRARSYTLVFCNSHMS